LWVKRDPHIAKKLGSVQARPIFRLHMKKVQASTRKPAAFLLLTSLIICVDATGLASPMSMGPGGVRKNNAHESSKGSMVKQAVEVDAQGQPQDLIVPEPKVDEEKQSKESNGDSEEGQLLEAGGAAGLASENKVQTSSEVSMVRQAVQVDAQGQTQDVIVPEPKVDEEKQYTESNGDTEEGQALEANGAAGLASTNNVQTASKGSMVRQAVQVDAQGQLEVLGVAEPKVDEEKQYKESNGDSEEGQLVEAGEILEMQAKKEEAEKSEWACHGTGSALKFFWCLFTEP